MPACFLEIAVVLLGLILALVEAFAPGTDRRFIGYLALAGLAAVFAGLFAVVTTPGDTPFASYYTADSLAMFYKGIAIVATGLMILLGLDYLPVLEKFTPRIRGGTAYGEFFVLPVFVCAGLMWMASATDLTSIFVSLELVTITFYVMAGFMRRNVGSLEAGVKYLILGALSTGFLVYGFTWLIGLTGQTNLARIGDVLAAGNVPTVPALFSFSLILAALAFKLGAVPLHFWIPDVYQGAPTPVTAWLSTASKAAGFIVATRLLEPFLAAEALRPVCASLLAAAAAATLIVGNFSAIPQSNFKRLLAYSSISHAGFLLLALSGAGGFGLSPAGIVAFYLGVYAIMTMLAFAVLAIVGRVTGSDGLRAFNGLHERSPFLAFALLVAMASLAGVPLTAGFLGKFLVFGAAVQNHLWVPLAAAIAGAAAGFYYYLKVVRHMYWDPAADTAAIPLCPLTRATLVLLIAGTIVFGVYPAPLFALLP